MRPIILAGTTDPFARKVYEAIGDDLRDRVRLWTRHLAEPGGLEALLETQPAVVVLGPGLVDEVSLRFAQQIDAERAEVGVVVVQNAGTNVDAALAAGVRGILSQDSDADSIRAAIEGAAASVDRYEERAQTQLRKPSVGRAKVTTVLSPKGGAGKTVLSTNLAVGLASVAPRGVVIVDLDLQFGDVAYALGLKPRHTMYDVVSTAGPLDITTLKVFLTHHSSDLYVMCAPDEPARGEVIGVEAVQQIISLLAADFDHVVVDTAAGLSEHTLATLDLSTDVIFLADQDVPSVHHLNKVIKAFDRLGMQSAERHFVLNRADARVGLTMMKVANQAGLAVDVEIPLSKQVPIALNAGSPLILSHPKNPVSRKIWEIVERLAGPQVRESRQPLKWSA